MHHRRQRDDKALLVATTALSGPARITRMYVPRLAAGLPPCRAATRTMRKGSAIGGWRVAFVA